jgi:hypothetical protein
LRNSKKAATAAAYVLTLVLGACAAPMPRVTGFAWMDAGGEGLAFRQAAGWEAGMEGRFGPGRLENSYTLEKAHRVEAASIEISVAADPAGPAGRELSIRISLRPIGKGFEPIASAGFPLRSAMSRFVLSLPAGTELGSLSARVEGAPAGEADGSIYAQIAGIRETSDFRGFSAKGEGPRVSSGFSFVSRGGESLLSIDAPFERSSGLVLEYGTAPEGSRIVLSGRAAGGGEATLALATRPRGSRIVLGPEAFPAGLVSLEARAQSGVAMEAFYAEGLDAREYELADLGRVLRSSPILAGPGARSGYDLYRWDILPSVLVLDFADYSIQDRYLKRLAFFVEKAGYRGSLQRDEVIGPLHGWNAHDYRPEDLAAFFSAARAKGFPLNAEEESLGRLLLERGILVERGGKLEPGKGALISISRQSPAYLRRTFIVHESTHALFFADPEYRAFASAEWAAMGEAEKWFWKRYFRWMVYDTGSEYLMANEYQAYLLQQPLSKAAEYFAKSLPANLLVPDVLKREPELRAKVDAYMEEFGDSFLGRAARLDAWLKRKYGIGAGKTYFLE